MKQKKSEIVERDRVVSFLRVLRHSFPDAAIIFTHGACFGLYQILHEVFQSAVPYMTEDEKHVVTKVGERFYDINGGFVDVRGNTREKLIRLNPRQIEYWESCADGQRVEYMLRKYNS